MSGGLSARWWTRILDGSRRWGAIDVQPSRWGVTRYRLIVYPPGVTDDERRRLRLWRGYPAWGALMWIASEIVLTHGTAPFTALLISTSATVIAGCAATMRAADTRGRVRTLTVTTVSGYHDPESVARFGKIKTLVGVLADADDALRVGTITPVHYEAIWWDIYRQVDDEHHTVTGAR